METYKGYTIEIEQDVDPVNPFTDWDFEPLLFTLHDGSLHYYEDGEHHTGRYHDLPELTREEAKEHWQEFTDFASIKDFMCFASYRQGDKFEDLLNEYISDQYHGTGREKLELLHKVFTAKGYPCKLSSSQGYSQSCYAEVLVVLTPDWFKSTGCNPDDDHKGNMQGTIDLYNAWAWGDVYGYVIKKPNECEHCHQHEPEEIDSCWGFYGDDHEKSGLLDQARSIIDCEVGV